MLAFSVLIHVFCLRAAFHFSENQIKTRAVCKTCMPPIWAISCSGSHCVNTFFVTVNNGGGGDGGG